MIKNFRLNPKGIIDKGAIKLAKKSLINSLENNGIEIKELLTPQIEAKFDELALAIIQEHGYKKLIAHGFKAYAKDKIISDVRLGFCLL